MLTLTGAMRRSALRAARRVNWNAHFRAHLDNTGVLAGSFTQGGNTAPFELKQIGAAQVELPPEIHQSGRNSKASGTAGSSCLAIRASDFEAL